MTRKSSLTLFLVIALLALLPLLAILQFHWLGEVSRGERERMKSNLQISASQFGQDFDREVKNIFLHFQNGLFPSSRNSSLEISELYRRWQADAAQPRLVKEIYQAQMNSEGRYELARFVPESGGLDLSEWPENFSVFRRSLEQHRKASESAQMILQGVLNRRAASGSETNIGSAIVQFSIGPIDDQIPGLVIPLIASPNAEKDPQIRLPLHRAYRIVVLDLDFIKNEFLPEIVKRRFYSGGASDYNVLVGSHQDSGKILYRSNPDLTAQSMMDADVSEPFFKVRINEFDRMVVAKGQPDAGKEIQGGIDDRRIAISVIQAETSLRQSSGDQKRDEPSRAIFKMNTEGHWQIAVKHRAGSLDAAVAGARRRNLAISFGVLLLLGLSMGLIVISSRRAQKLAEQQVEFVAGVTHELRTPLAVICSAAENLADGVVDDGEQIKRYGGLIRDEGRRLAGMVEQALEFAGAQSGRKAYDLRPTDLGGVIDHALAACRLQIIEGSFETEKCVAENLPAIKADALALSRAIQNLIGNAIKYSGESRWIGVSANVAKTRTGEEAQIKVSDRGLGIEASELPHIFTPFRRGKEAVAAQIHGNGLGLSLVKHIIEAHGGRVSVESKFKRGTVFTLHLPIGSAEDASTESIKDDYEQAHFAR